MRKSFLGVILLFAAAGLLGQSAALPATPGETLSGKRIVLAEALRGHAAVLVMSFSRDAGKECDLWGRLVRADPAMSGVAVVQVAMLERAPGFVRGVIKNGLRKGLSAAEQDRSVILTQDEKLWRSYLGVTVDRDPYVVLLDAAGQVRWRGHGAARDQEPLLKAALR